MDKQAIIIICMGGVMGMLVALGIGEHIFGRHADLLSVEMLQHDLAKLKQLTFKVSLCGIILLAIGMWAVVAIEEEE